MTVEFIFLSSHKSQQVFKVPTSGNTAMAMSDHGLSPTFKSPGAVANGLTGLKLRL